MTTPRDINPPFEPAKGPHAEFGERFRALRLRMGVTLSACARTTGMSMSQISDIERGQILPSTLDIWPLLEWASGYIESKRK